MKLGGDVLCTILDVPAKFEAIPNPFALFSRHFKKTVSLQAPPVSTASKAVLLNKAL